MTRRRRGALLVVGGALGPVSEELRRNLEALGYVD